MCNTFGMGGGNVIIPVFLKSLNGIEMFLSSKTAPTLLHIVVTLLLLSFSSVIFSLSAAFVIRSIVLYRI